MKKVAMLGALIAGMAMTASLTLDGRPQAPKKALDTEVIVEVDRSLSTLTNKGVYNVQKAVRDNIKRYVTSNFRYTGSFHVLNNAFTIAINSDYVEQLKDVPGVKSVTKNELHWVTYAQQDDGLVSRGSPSNTKDYGGKTNISAVTMKKPGANESLPGTTNEGEGTLIAILDNEFYFRGEHTEGNEVVASWNHETFDPLKSTVKKRFDFITSGDEEEVAASKAAYLELVGSTHAATKDEDYDKDPEKATKVVETALGKEGSLYYNNKVPFYFDYGGEKEIHSDYVSFDFDVSSEVSYHGSHVASIASGNADTYKGIAPNAQLVCMKVFTNFKPNKVEEAVGLQASSGAYDIPILRALEDCVTLGVDGINMSLGSNLNDFDQDSITVKTLKDLAQSGILTSISAGNDGKSSYGFAGGYGNWTFDMVETGILSGYANQADSMTIASGQPTRKFYTNAFKMGDAYVEFEDQVVNRDGLPDDFEVQHKMSDLIDPEDPELRWVYVPGFGTADDYAGLDVGDAIAVVKRGSTSFSDKYKVAYGKGAKGLIVINNDPTASSFNMRMSFGDDQPEIPVAFVLYADMPHFGSEGDDGKFTIINDKIGDNIRAYTASTFSSDGATFDLQLKPEITAPGENIRGAVPPQTKEDREEGRTLSTYEFLSGTSMSAPNYAGAQSVILSKKAVWYIDELNKINNDSEKTDKQKEALRKAARLEYENYRDTVNMRLMSTSEPMLDYDPDPETLHEKEQEVRSLTSPRIQGAGMANIGAAYNTEVYFEGLSQNGTKGIGKSKIELRNNAEINKGNISISFLAHNESETITRKYDVKLTIMRPAVKYSTDVVSKEYKDCGDVSKIEEFPGRVYYDQGWVTDPETGESKWSPAVADMSASGFAHNDVYKVTKDITYWASEGDCKLDHPDKDEKTWTTEHLTTLKAGRYYNAGNSEEAIWLPLPEKEYQSTQDTVLDVIDLQEITVAPGKSKIQLQSHSLTNEQKEDIAKYFEYGCYLEGYLTFKSQDESADLSMPWMGFYGGDGDYESAPVVEPFSFEKDIKTIYPSDLVNDVTKSLLGKSNVDFGSEWITTYVEQGKSFNSAKILENDESLSHLCESGDYHLVGTDVEGNRYANPEDNIYVGNPNTSNTMIIQQFVLRSCADNYFTIKDSKGKMVYKDALQDMLFGGELRSWPLYKSHVDATYLSGGYVAHRAFAVIPLYNDKGEAFASGEYTIEFNYLLAATGNWVSKSYHFTLDSDSPTISSVKEEGENIKINITEANIASVTVGMYNKTDDLVINEAKGTASLTLSKREAIKIMNESLNRENGTGHLFVGMTDKAYGYTGAIIKFNKKDRDAAKHYPVPEPGSEEIDVSNCRFVPLFNNYTIAENYEFNLSHDIEDLGATIKFYFLSVKGDPTEITPVGYTKITKYPSSGGSSSSSDSGCSGNVATTSITLSALAGALAISLIIANKRKRKIGGQK